MRTIRNRLIVILGLVLLSAWLLAPKDVTQRVRDSATGRMKDTTIHRVPINLGLDLQGGIHLALEVDQTKGPVPDCADAIQRAEKVDGVGAVGDGRSEEHTSELQSRLHLVCRLLLEKKKKTRRVDV